MTSSPGPTPISSKAKSMAEVQELTVIGLVDKFNSPVTVSTKC